MLFCGCAVLRSAVRSSQFAGATILSASRAYSAVNDRVCVW
jgi:hypothetical protein